MNGAGPVPPDAAQPPVMEDGDLLGTMSALLRATQTLADQAAASAVSSPAEAQKLMSAALAGAQSWSILNPLRITGGDTPEARADSVPTPPATTDGDRDGKIGER